MAWKILWDRIVGAFSRWSGVDNAKKMQSEVRWSESWSDHGCERRMEGTTREDELLFQDEFGQLKAVISM